MYKAKYGHLIIGAMLCIALFFSCATPNKSEFNPDDLQIINQTINDARITYNVNQGIDPPDYKTENKLSNSFKINEYLNINIVSTSNIRGNVFDTTSRVDISKLASFITSLKEKESNQVLLLDSGDFSYGNDYSNIFKGENVANLLGYLNYDAVSIGSTDFNFGLKQFDRNMLVLSARGVAILSNNIRIGGRRVFPSSKIFDYQGFKIAVVGLSDVLTRASSLEFNTGAVQFNENVLVNLKQEIDRVKSTSDYVILLSSNSIDDNNLSFYSSICENIDGINLIIAKDNRKDNSTPLQFNGVSVYGSSDDFQNIYLTTLKINQNKELIEVNTQYLSTSDINSPLESDNIKSLGLAEFKEDNNITLYNKEKTTKAEETLSQEVATINSSVAVDKNWTTEMLLTSILNYTRADVVLYPEKHIKSSLNNGNLKLSDLYSVTDDNSDIVTVLMNSSQLKSIINNAVLLTTEDNNTQLATNLRIEWQTQTNNEENSENNTVQTTVKTLSLATRALSESDDVYYTVALPYSTLTEHQLEYKEIKYGLKTNLIFSGFITERYKLVSEEQKQSQQSENKTNNENDVETINKINQEFNTQPSDQTQDNQNEAMTEATQHNLPELEADQELDFREAENR